MVIGGSISGLFAALFLRRSGWRVDVFERTETQLTGRGAGIVTHPELSEMLGAAGLNAGPDFGIEIAGRKMLDRAGRMIGDHPRRQLVTSWDRVYRMLSDGLPAECYHIRKELIRIEERENRVIAHFVDGPRDGELLIGADGFRSTVRAQCLAEAQPNYAGYVAWRGLVMESALSDDARREIFDSMIFFLPPREQILGYPVAGVDNDLRPGHRRYNFVWYRPADDDGGLRDLLTDDSGTMHPLSIPPPLIRKTTIDAFRDAAEQLLPPQLREVVKLAPQPFLQPIYDLTSPKMAIGRVAIIGDAAFVARPHVGAGVTKAAQDAQALAQALRTERDIEHALQNFERARMPVNRRIVERGRELGAYLAAGASIAEPPTSKAVMEDIAMLDFLHG